LDDDDEYKPTFLADMLEFAYRKSLDAACCSIEFYHVAQKAVGGYRAVQQELIIEGEGFGEFFPYYHAHMRTWWAKLFKMQEVVQAVDAEAMLAHEFMSDTEFAFEMLLKSKRVGISNKVCHRYYLDYSSGSYNISSKYWTEHYPVALHSHTVNFLKTKAGYASGKNMSFLYLVYLNNTLDTVKVIAASGEITEAERFAMLRRIYSRSESMEALNDANADKSLSERFIAAAYEAVQNSPHTPYYEDAIWLGLTCSAYLGLQSDYVKYSKLNITHLFENGKIDEATRELAEWESILPNDEDIQEMSMKLR
jgi:hypothetical protein